MRRRDIENILHQAGARPRHRLGQHFMIDPRVLRAILDAADLHGDDVVLEVGPGPGNLTALLSEKTGTVLAVDIDSALLAAAAQHWNHLKNVQWLRADVLAGKHEINPAVTQALLTLLERTERNGRRHRRGKLVANLPYNVASPLVAELLLLHWRNRHDSAPGGLLFERLVFTVQREVALRMRATAGTAAYGALGIIIQLLGDVEILRMIAPESFWPPPQVHSALVLIRPNEAKMAALSDAVGMQRILAGLFAHRRQNLVNAIRHGFPSVQIIPLLPRLQASGIDPRERAENLAPEQLLLLCEMLPAGDSRWV